MSSVPPAGRRGHTSGLGPRSSVRVTSRSPASATKAPAYGMTWACRTYGIRRRSVDAQADEASTTASASARRWEGAGRVKAAMDARGVGLALTRPSTPADSIGRCRDGRFASINSSPPWRRVPWPGSRGSAQGCRACCGPVRAPSRRARYRHLRAPRGRWPRQTHVSPTTAARSRGHPPDVSGHVLTHEAP